MWNYIFSSFSSQNETNGKFHHFQRKLTFFFNMSFRKRAHTKRVFMRYSFSYAMKFWAHFSDEQNPQNCFYVQFWKFAAYNLISKWNKNVFKRTLYFSKKNVAPKIDYFFLICLLVKLQVLNALPKIVNFASLALSKNSILVDILLDHFGTEKYDQTF